MKISNFLTILIFQFLYTGLAIAEPSIDQPYLLISKKQINRTIYEYTYRAKIINDSVAKQNVSATVSSNTANTSIIDNTLSFNNLTSGETSTSTDTFTIRQDRRFKFDPNILSWKISFVSNSSKSISKTISSTGGSIELSGVASVSFPDGSFSDEQNVNLAATSLPETAADFELTSQIFSAGKRVSYEVRINTGETKSAKPITALIDVPANFLSTIPYNSEIKVFAQVFQDGGDEVLDNFELFPSTFSLTNKRVEVNLPPEVFTNRRNTDETFEAIIIVGTTPTKQNISPTSSLKNRTKSIEKPLNQPLDATRSILSLSLNLSLSKAAAITCEGATLGAPIENRTVTSSYNGSNHYGTDYRAANGTEVFAASDGVIEKVGFNERPLPRPDPRSGKSVKGWGKYIVLKHTDGSKTLYAHLESSSLPEGTQVNKGDQIALSDNSGGSSGPHLHFEYAPNGQIYQNASKINPEPCIDQNVSGSITVSDNGSLADDAFKVSINGLVVCTTSIGASNTCGIGNLRSGTASLVITAVIAPDNVGTYQIDLAEGLTFSDESTSRSSTLPQGGTDTYSILIP